MSHTATKHECHIVTKLTGKVRVVRVTGRLDWATAKSFGDPMRDEWTDEMLIVDLSGMAGMDSAGTGEILAATARARHRGQQLVIVTVDPILMAVLSSLGPSLPVVSSPIEAWRFLCAGPEPKVAL